MEEKRFDLSQLYIVDFAKNLTHKKNISALIYLAINVLILTFLVQLVEPNFWLSLLYGILLYGVTATIALSPIGEMMFRFFNGCKKIQDPHILNRLEPLFEEVKGRATSKHSDFVINQKISLYICNDDSINAFALGRRTVCVTHGLLSLPDEQIKAVIGHEFGHLATHDTDLLLLITVGNFLVTAIVTVVRVILDIYNRIICGIVGGMFSENGGLGRFLYWLQSLITTFFINGLMWLWTQLGIVLVMKSSRNAEYEADAFSCNLGYTEELLSFFRFLQGLERSSGRKDTNNIFAALSKSHPNTEDRIARIENRAMVAIEE